MFRSVNGGANWNPINTGLTNLNISSLTVDPVNSNIIYACTLGGGIFKSINRGENWSAINSGLVGLSSKTLAIDYSNNNILYAGVSGAGAHDGVYQSLNGGSSWNNFNSGLPQNTDVRQITDVRCISIDPINSKNVYVGLLAYGVYKYSINNPPSFKNLPASKSIISGMPFTYQLETFDPEGDTLTYSLEGAPTGMNISPSGLISWLGSKTGSYTITVKISDRVNSPVTSTLYLKVSTTLIFTIDKKDYLVNDIRQTMEVAPIIREGRTLLPVRFVAEPLGATVLWDNATRKVTVILEKNTIEMWIDKPIAQINGKIVYIDPVNPKVVPIIINGRTLLPLRFIAENLGAEVAWNGVNRTVTVIYPR